MNADKFTQKTIETIQTAQSMAQENGNQYLTPEHLLYALVDADGGLIGTLLGRMGVDCNAVLSELDTAIDQLPKVSGGSGEVYASPETSKIFNFAEREAKSGGDKIFDALLVVQPCGDMERVCLQSGSAEKIIGGTLAAAAILPEQERV